MLHKALDVPFPVVDLWYNLISLISLGCYMFVTRFLLLPRTSALKESSLVFLSSG